MNWFLMKWLSTRPRAKWLIVWATLYGITAFALLIAGKTDDWLWLAQLIWIFISSIPLWCKPFADWLEMKPRLTDWITNRFK